VVIVWFVNGITSVVGGDDYGGRELRIRKPLKIVKTTI